MGSFRRLEWKSERRCTKRSTAGSRSHASIIPKRPARFGGIHLGAPLLPPAFQPRRDLGAFGRQIFFLRAIHAQVEEAIAFFRLDPFPLANAGCPVAAALPEHFGARGILFATEHG